MIEDLLAADLPSAAQIGAFCAILSGTLPRHKHRGESNVFPVWRTLPARASEAERADLQARVQSTL